MASKGVIDRHRVARVLAAAAHIHAPAVGERLQEVLAPAFPDGEVPFDGVQLLDGLGRYLEMRIEAMNQADETHLRELRDDDGPRRRRDEAAEELYSTLVGIRQAVLAGFGPEQLKPLLGYVGSTPDDPLVLFRVAGRALELLRTPPAELPPARFPGVQVDLVSLADELQPALDQLTAALREVDEESKTAELTRRSKDLELDAFDAAVAGIGRMLIGADELTGFSQLAERVRLTLPNRRRRGTASEEEEPLPEEAPSEEEAPPVGETPPEDESPGLPPRPRPPAPIEGPSGGDV